jgi:trimeric autotransporter adhesin
MKLNNVYFALAILFCASMAHAQVTGSGTTDFVPLWTGTTSLGNSAISQKGANVGIGTKTPGTKLSVVGSTATNAVITGKNSAATGAPIGLLGIVGAPSGDAVYGHATTTASGANAEGVFGQSDAPNGVGVNGVATSTSGNGIGVTGSSPSTGVFGYTTATTGYVAGVLGSSGASSGQGVLGVATGVNGIGLEGNSPYWGIEAFNGTCDSSGCTPSAGDAGIFITGSGGNILVGNVASPTNNWTTVVRVDSTGKGFFDGGTQTGGADFAESVSVAKAQSGYEPGDLLVVDTNANRQLAIASEPYSVLVAGIYSTKPGVLASTHKLAEAATNEIPLAIVGIVPCKVTAENGPIARGDLLVTSSTPGHAMRGTDRSRMLGAVVGKALEPLSEGRGVIQVLVTLQ